MFVGEFNHTLDDKGRVTIPARFRPDLATGAVITRGMDGCLALYPNNAWDVLAEKVNALPVTDRRARDFRRFMFGSASEVVPDRQGRILIPAYLRQYAHVNDGEVTVVGNYSYIEIWNPETWQEQRQGVESDEGNAEHWAVLGI
jgi:MraZ protein